MDQQILSLLSIPTSACGGTVHVFIPMLWLSHSSLGTPTPSPMASCLIPGILLDPTQFPVRLCRKTGELYGPRKKKDPLIPESGKGLWPGKNQEF